MSLLDTLDDYNAAEACRRTAGQASAVNVARRIDEENVVAHHERIALALSQLSAAVQRMDDFVRALNEDVCDVVADAKTGVMPTLHHTLMLTPGSITENTNRIDGLRERLGELLYGNK